MRSNKLTKRVQFRVDAKSFGELEAIASKMDTKPGHVAKRALLRELECDVDAQLEGLRHVVQEHGDSLIRLRGRLKSIASMLSALNGNLRWVLVALLIEAGANEEAAKQKAAELVRDLKNDFSRSKKGRK